MRHLKDLAGRLTPSGWKRPVISWKVYQQDDNYDCDVLQQFKAMREAGEDSPLRTRGLTRSPEGKFEFDAIYDRTAGSVLDHSQ